MIDLTVNLSDKGARSGIAAILASATRRTELHEAMAAGVETAVADHLASLNTRSPHTSFYGRAARSTEAHADAGGARVVITHRGITLRYYGGRVVPKNVRNLAIPTDDVPLAGNEGRKAPREMGILAFLPPKKSAPPGTTGYLVEGRESGKRTVPLPGGKLLYTLRSWTDHKPDKSVLPAMAALKAAAIKAAESYLDSRANQP